LQVLLWTVSGLAFAWLDHADVASEGSVRAPPVRVLGPEDPVCEPDACLRGRAQADILDVTLAPLLDHWVYRVRLRDGIELRRAEDGARFTIDETTARALAVAHYAGKGTLHAVSFHPGTMLEARDAGPVWQAAFDDPERTSLYFSADDGRLVAARNDSWRLFDLFWMLHTMDYRGRDDFNHPLVILFATAALWLAISGGLLLFRAFGR
ncbi:MAG: PepSY domain-containing protein, partial [Steroidobacteraceae bacterium]